MADWSSLLPDLLDQIVKGLTFHEDVNCFAGVSKSWRSTAMTKDSNFNKPSRFPGLILPENEDDGDTRRFFTLSTEKISKFVLPEASKKQCTSSHGWLLTVGVDEIEAKLLHPFSRVQIDLPRLNTFPEWEYHSMENGYFISKLVLSSDPSITSDFLVMVMWGGMANIGFCRPGDASWTMIYECIGCRVRDITYHGGHLYAVNNHGKIMRFDVHGRNPNAWTKVSLIPRKLVTANRVCVYILEFFGKLLIVSRPKRLPRKEGDLQVPKKCYTDTLKVFELTLNETGGKGKWCKLKNLGKNALFLGFNSSTSIEAHGCIKPNSIYFTDDFWEISTSDSIGGGWDTGIYNLSDGSVEPLFNRLSLKPGCMLTPPTWVIMH